MQTRESFTIARLRPGEIRDWLSLIMGVIPSEAEETRCENCSHARGFFKSALLAQVDGKACHHGGGTTMATKETKQAYSPGLAGVIAGGDGKSAGSIQTRACVSRLRHPRDGEKRLRGSRVSLA